MKHRHIDIVLEGIDTVANVALNNVFLLSTHNMFQRFVIDITNILKVCLHFRIYVPVMA